MAKPYSHRLFVLIHTVSVGSNHYWNIIESDVPPPMAATSSDVESTATKDKDTDKVPKAVQAARDFLGDSAITGAAIAQLPSKTCNSLGVAFRASLSEPDRIKYSQLTTHESRREWIAQFVGDPNLGKKQGYNTFEALDSRKSIEDEEFLTEEQIASSAWLNSAANAKVLCESGELPSRPSRFKCLADQGVKEYRFTREKMEKMTGWTQKAGVDNRSDMTKEEYQAVALSITENISNDSTATVKKRKVMPTKTKEAESEDSKRLRAAIALRAGTLRKLKVQNDKVDKELRDSGALVTKLAAKGYPSQMGTFFQSQIDVVAKVCEENVSFYATEMAKPEGRCVNAAELEANTSVIESKLEALDQAFQSLKKSHIADLKKLVG